MGELVPIQCVEVIPGDTVRGSSSALIRVTPQAKPVMHPTQARIHHFFVPNRLIWSGWEDFITGVSATPPPTISGGTHTEGSLSDYLGVYNDASNDFNALPVRAYNKIYNEYYRDQDIISEVSEDTDTIQKIAWGKDYFTAARATPQQGSAVSLPLGTTAPVTTTQTDSATLGVFSTQENDWVAMDTDGNAGGHVVLDRGTVTGVGANNLYADLSTATAATIADLREAFALQKYAEARANWGENYVDYLRYLGINPSDSRLQRPEMLGGGRQAITFTEVLNTSNTNTGDLAGHGIAAMQSNNWQRYFEEHGWIISLMSVRPRSIYVNSLPRKFSRATKEDYFQKELANIGDQEVYNKEIYSADTGPDDVFGYSPRYDEYRREQSRVSAEMRNSTNYDWHMGRIFSADVALNQSFIECSPSKRVFQDQTEDSLWVFVNNSLYARRMVPKQAGYAGLV